MGTQPKERNSSGGEQKREFKKRAKRFPIQAPIQYRINGESDWSAGVTTNISYSGVLFQSRRDLQPKMMIEMRIFFSTELTGTVASNLFCRGLIVRTEAARDSKFICGLAGSIMSHHLVSE
jgi:hypothetical protein